MSLVFINSSGDTFTPTQSGAIGTWIWEVCRAAERGGVQPWVLTRRSPAAAHPWPKTVFVDYPPCPAHPRVHRLLHTWRLLGGWTGARQREYFQEVIGAIRREKLDRFPLFLQNDLELAVCLRRAFPAALIVHHAQNANASTWRFQSAFGRSVDLATAVTDFCARENSARFGCAVETLLSGVDVEAFAPAEAPPSGPRVINFVGRTDQAKGPDLLLKAALRLVGQVPPFALQILGRNFYDHGCEDDFQRELRSLAGELRGRGVEVRMPGWVTRGELPGELRRAHLHVVPARWDEPFGLTTLEGMSTGLATVAARTGGTPEVVGDAALLFERGSVEELAGCLQRLLCDEALRLEYAARARARALELTWDRTWSSLQLLVAHAEARRVARRSFEVPQTSSFTRMTVALSAARGGAR